MKAVFCGWMLISTVESFRSHRIKISGGDANRIKGKEKLLNRVRCSIRTSCFGAIAALGFRRGMVCFPT